MFVNLLTHPPSCAESLSSENSVLNSKFFLNSKQLVVFSKKLTMALSASLNLSSTKTYSQISNVGVFSLSTTVRSHDTPSSLLRLWNSESFTTPPRNPSPPLQGNILRFSNQSAVLSPKVSLPCSKWWMILAPYNAPAFSSDIFNKVEILRMVVRSDLGMGVGDVWLGSKIVGFGVVIICCLNVALLAVSALIGLGFDNFWP